MITNRVKATNTLNAKQKLLYATNLDDGIVGQDICHGRRPTRKLLRRRAFSSGGRSSSVIDEFDPSID